jgi:hypothetical protein
MVDGRSLVRRFVANHRLAFWLVVVALAIVVWILFFVAGHGSVSGGSN